MKQLTILLMALLLFSCAGAEETSDDIRSAASIEEALVYLILPEGEGAAPVQRGYIRYITQDAARDPAYRKIYWLGGEEGSDLDLTLEKNRYGHVYTFHSGVMCTRAAYSMALSYLGIDMSPGAMTAATGKRNLNPPYESISEMVGVESSSPRSHVFNTMMERYLTDSSYSPVYLYLEKPNGVEHAVLVVAALPETSRFLVVDSSAPWLEGEPYRVYMISLNKTRQEVVNSTFRADLAGSKVLSMYQWHLIESEE